MRWLVTTLGALLATAFVALAALGGSLYWDRFEVRAEQSARDVLGPLAKNQVPAVLGYDFQTVERTLTDAYAMLTPHYRVAFEQKAQKQIIPEAREKQLVSQISVVGVGVIDAHRNSGSVMVYVNRTVSYKTNRNEPIFDGARIRVDYLRIDGKWLIDAITVI